MIKTKATGFEIMFKLENYQTNFQEKVIAFRERTKTSVSEFSPLQYYGVSRLKSYAEKVGKEVVKESEVPGYDYKEIIETNLWQSTRIGKMGRYERKKKTINSFIKLLVVPMFNYCSESYKITITENKENDNEEVGIDLNGNCDFINIFNNLLDHNDDYGIQLRPNCNFNRILFYFLFYPNL